MKKIIAITGTPGVGKTRLANELAQRLGYMHIELTTYIKIAKVHDGYDKKTKSYTVDTDKLVEEIQPLLTKTKRSILVDGHLSHFLPRKTIDLCIVVTCSLKKLQKRLEKRGYSKAKIRENLDSEIFEVCLHEAEENKHNILVVNESDNISETVKKIKKNLLVR